MLRADESDWHDGRISKTSLEKHLRLQRAIAGFAKGKQNLVGHVRHGVDARGALPEVTQE